MVGVRDEADRASVLTLVASTDTEQDSDAIVTTLEGWCTNGSRLELDRTTTGGYVELRHVDERRTLALRLAA
jgi:hypothetical protein